MKTDTIDATVPARLYENQGASGLMRSGMLVLMCIAYFQPITRTELSTFFGKEVSRDLIGHLRGAKMIASGRAARRPARPAPM